QGAVVGEDDVVADDAVVGDVAVCEEIPVVADDGPGLRSGAAIHGAEFAKDVAIADLEVGRLVGVLQILDALADGGVGKELVVGADLAGPGNGDMAVEAAALAEADARSNHAIGPDVKVLAELRL